MMTKMGKVSCPAMSCYTMLHNATQYYTLLHNTTQYYTLLHIAGHSMRKDEIALLSGPDEFGEFYRRLKTLKDFHRRHPNEVAEPMVMEFLKLDKQRTHPPEHLQSPVDFSDEEGYGKFLDMHELHDTFINLRQMEVG